MVRGSNVGRKSIIHKIFVPRQEKTGLRGFQPGVTQMGLCSHRKGLNARNFKFNKKTDCNIQVVKTKALICFVLTANWSAPLFSHRQKSSFLMTWLIWILNVICAYFYQH